VIKNLENIFFYSDIIAKLLLVNRMFKGGHQNKVLLIILFYLFNYHPAP